MELARRRALGLAAAALAVLAALALALSPGRAHAVAVDDPIYVEVGEGRTVAFSYGTIYSAISSDPGVAMVDALSSLTEFSVDGVRKGSTTIKVDAEGSSEVYIYSVTVTDPAPIYTLTLAASPADGGTVTAGKKEGIREGEKVGIKATPGDGFEFVGWTGDGTIADPAATSTTVTMPGSDATVTATFKKKPVDPKVTVESDGAGTVDVKHDEAGRNWALTAKASPGWKFKCWREDGQEKTTETYAIDDSVAHDVVAVFEKAPAAAYAITFNANGGTGTMDKQATEAGAAVKFDANGGTGSTDDLTGDEGSTVTLTANAFTRDGYTFAGWNTAKDGSGTAYKDKAEVKLEGDMTLYAQWTKKAAAKSSARTGDTAVPVAVVAVIAVIAAGALVVARRKMG